MRCLRSALVVLLVVFIGHCVAQDDASPKAAESTKTKPAPKQTVLKISKETTYVEGPLDDRGFVDYVAALNEKFKDGVKPEDNAAVWLARANGVNEIVDAATRTRFFKAMGIEAVLRGGKVIAWQDFARKFPDTKGLDQNSLWDRRGRGRERPWTADDDVVLARWVEANDEAIELFVKASKCSRYYTPYLSTPDDPGPKVVAILLPIAQESREAVRMLSIRAMYRIGNGDLEGAMEDALACHRLSRLISRGFTIIEVLVGIACDSIAGEINRAISRHPKLSSKMALNYQKQLESLPPLDLMADKIDIGERFMMLDAVTSIVKDGPQALQMLGGLAGNGDAGGLGGAIGKFFTRNSVDWNQATKDLNGWYDALVDGMRKPTRVEREKALGMVDAQIQAVMTDTRDKKNLFFAVLSRKRRTETITNVLVALLMPAVIQAQTASDRADMNMDLTRMALGLEAYRKDNGQYPVELKALVPKYIAAVPQDIFSRDGRAPLHYEPKDAQYKLYSVGRNGKDDGGIPLGNRLSDDLVVQNPAYEPAE